MCSTSFSIESSLAFHIAGWWISVLSGRWRKRRWCSPPGDVPFHVMFPSRRTWLSGPCVRNPSHVPGSTRHCPPHCHWGTRSPVSSLSCVGEHRGAVFGCLKTELR